jgi:hypothetical protein
MTSRSILLRETYVNTFIVVHRHHGGVLQRRFAASSSSSSLRVARRLVLIAGRRWIGSSVDTYRGCSDHDPVGEIAGIEAMSRSSSSHSERLGDMDLCKVSIMVFCGPLISVG